MRLRRDIGIFGTKIELISLDLYRLTRRFGRKKNNSCCYLFDVRRGEQVSRFSNRLEILKVVTNFFFFRRERFRLVAGTLPEQCRTKAASSVRSRYYLQRPKPFRINIIIVV